MNTHTRLHEHATGILHTVFIEKLRGVTAKWNENTDTLHITFYFEGEPSEEEVEEASVASTDIIAGLPIAYMEENYVNLENPVPLPESKFWVFRRKE